MSVESPFNDGVTVPEEPSLAAAASDGLDEFLPGNEPEQMALVALGKIKFPTVMYDSIEELPGLKESLSFRLDCFVVGHSQIVKANGEIADMATVKVTKVTPIA